MHVIFMPWGKFERIQDLFIDLRAQKHEMIFTSPDGKKTAKVWIEGQLRLLPFGFTEYVFPREDLDKVLTTLFFDKNIPQRLGKARMAIIRKVLNAQKAPEEFKTDKKYLWRTAFVGIVQIGIKEDNNEATENAGIYKGWTHEGM